MRYDVKCSQCGFLQSFEDSRRKALNFARKHDVLNPGHVALITPVGEYRTLSSQSGCEAIYLRSE